MKKCLVISFLLLFILGFSHCRKPGAYSVELFDPALSGGKQTSFDFTSQAFSIPFEGLSGSDLALHMKGDAAFDATFIAAPATINSGLGPAYNNVSCASCHHNDGIGVPTTGQAQSGLLMRISAPGQNQYGPLPVQGYGTQLQDQAIVGKPAECKVNIQYSYQTYSFADGETYELRAPNYSLSQLYLPITGSYLLSPRLAPPVFGLGLLEAIAHGDIVANADPHDADQDHISGKANYVWNPETNSVDLGRFGLKANTATLLTQVAAAYNNDMGITSSVFPQETIHGQIQADLLDDDAELPDDILHAAKFYIQTLKVPARRDVENAQVKEGEQLFLNAQCQKCHVTTFRTKVNVAFPPLSNQRIHPYTDLLLHDMGEGLSDHRPDFLAEGNEWRTSPLWGIGLFEKVNYPAYYLHDGRARTLTEAIMWHDGEAKESVTYFKQLNKTKRDALLKFLKSL